MRVLVECVDHIFYLLWFKKDHAVPEGCWVVEQFEGEFRDYPEISSAS